MPTIQDARTFASRYHTNLYGDKPYTYHLDQVAAIAIQYLDLIQTYETCTMDRVVAVAYLHDVLEDTKVTIEILLEAFGANIANDVWCLTDANGTNRKERKLNTWWKIRSSRVATYIKLCDRIANTKECLRQEKQSLLGMYQKEFPLFEAALYVPDTPLEPLWKDLKSLTGLK